VSGFGERAGCCEGVESGFGRHCVVAVVILDVFWWLVDWLVG
jgi:uncharacterized protein (DUF2237 family)